MSKLEQKLGHVSMTHTRGLLSPFAGVSVSSGEGSRKQTGEAVSRGGLGGEPGSRGQRESRGPTLPGPGGGGSAVKKEAGVEGREFIIRSLQGSRRSCLQTGGLASQAGEAAGGGGRAFSPLQTRGRRSSVSVLPRGEPGSLGTWDGEVDFNLFQDKYLGSTPCP